MIRHSASIALYILLDVGLSLLFLGFYLPSWKFEFDLIRKYTLFVDGYNFLSNPFDFVALSLLRTIFLSIGVGFIAFNRETVAKHLFMPMLLFGVFSYSFALVKLLAFSEDVKNLSFPGLWLSVLWSLISNLLFAAIWYIVLTKHKISYQQLVNAVSQENLAVTSDDERPLFSDLRNQTTATEATAATAADSDSKPRMSTLKHVWLLFAYCRDQWMWFAGGLTFLIIYAVARVFIPAMIGQVIGDIVKVRGIEVLVRSVLIMAALTFTSSIFGGLRGGCFNYATARVSRQIRLDLFNSLVIQDIAFFDVTKSGEMVSRLTSDCQTMSSTVSTNLNVFLRNTVMLVGSLVYMFIMSWRLTTVTLIAVPFIGFVTKWYGSYFDHISEKIQDTIGKANHVAEEVLSSMRTVRSFACERREAMRFEDQLDNTLNQAKKRSVAAVGYICVNEIYDNTILSAYCSTEDTSSFPVRCFQIKLRKMSPDELITFLLYQMQLGENLYNIGYVFSGLMEAVGASRKVFEYMNRHPEMPNDGPQKPTVNGKIEFHDVHFAYPSRPNNPVLKGLSLVIGAGETVALVGPSGGGKSSIVALIQHFYEPNQGEITLDGIPIRDISHVYFHQRIALVAQEPVLYDGSVRYNILYGCDWATEDDMLHAAKMANVHQFVMELEKGYDTNCGEKGVQMSGGQKQRIAIARALVRKPAVLILDEATSALDTESESLVQEALNRCANERTVLIIAHRLSTIEKADRIAVIQKGSLIQSGSHEQLMQDKDGLYYSLVVRQLLATKVGESE